MLCKLKPKSMQARYEAGRMGNACQEYEDAEDYLREALRLEPASTDTKYQLALSLYNQGVNRSESEELLNSVLENRPDHVKGLQLLSQLSLARKDYKKGLDCIDKILLQKPNLLSFCVQKAEILERLFQVEEQCRTFEFVLSQWQYRLTKDPSYFKKRPKEAANLEKIQQRVKRKHISEAYNSLKEKYTEFMQVNADLL